MSSSKDTIRGSLVIFEAVDAACNARAFFLFFISALAALAIAGVFMGIAATLVGNGSFFIAAFFSFIGWLMALVIAATGLMAAGKTLMDALQGRTQLSVGEALLAGLLTLPKLLAVFLIEFGIFLVFVIALAIVLFICKIPYLGPLLYTVVYPIASVITGILFFSFAFIVNPLAAPAFWDNYGIGQAMAVFGLGKEALNVGRLFPPIVQQLVLFFAVMVVSFIASAIVFGGAAFVGMLGAGILGFGREISGIFNNPAGLGNGLEGGGYLIATTIGLAILGAIAYTFPLLVYMAGTCRIFLNLANAGAGSAAASVGTSSTPPPASPAQFAPAPTSTPTPTPAKREQDLKTCPACHAPVEPDDAFCGECGADLPGAA